MINNYNWLRPGAKLKRWIILGIIGILMICIGVYPLIQMIFQESASQTNNIQLILPGILLIIISIKQGFTSLISVIASSKLDQTMRQEDINRALYNKRILVRGPKIVAIGGGTGLSALLRGVKRYTSNITAIVTVADDGGSSGMLREDLGILPPGDIRNCILALAETEPIMKDLLQHRFTEGSLKGQSFGNLFIAAMTAISPSFEEAIKEIANVLAVTGNVIPVTNQSVTLCAQLEDGTIIEGESKIPTGQILSSSPIKRVFLKPESPQPLIEAIEAIEDADAIVLGPGSLYTSIIPNLLVRDMANSIHKSRAIKIYVPNIMTQPGETTDYTVSRHVKAIIDHHGQNFLNYIVVNNEDVPQAIVDRYREEGAVVVQLDRKKLDEWGIKTIEAPLISTHGDYLRHDSLKLAKTIMGIVLGTALKKDKRRILDYFFLKELLKKR